jgi:hypothetical protein
MRKVKLISDGTVHGTKLLNEDGRLIPGITRIEIEPIDAKKNRLTQIKVTMLADLEITGDIAELDVEGIYYRKGEMTHGINRDSDQARPHYSYPDQILSVPIGGGGGGGGGGGFVHPDDASGGSGGSDPHGNSSGGGQGRSR